MGSWHSLAFIGKGFKVYVFFFFGGGGGSLLGFFFWGGGHCMVWPSLGIALRFVFLLFGFMLWERLFRVRVSFTRVSFPAFQVTVISIIFIDILISTNFKNFLYFYIIKQKTNINNILNSIIFRILILQRPHLQHSHSLHQQHQIHNFLINSQKIDSIRCINFLIFPVFILDIVINMILYFTFILITVMIKAFTTTSFTCSSTSASSRHPRRAKSASPHPSTS